MTSASIHANCVVIGTRGVLIRGGSGSGKSCLSETLIEAARARGQFAALTADDRVLLRAEAGRLLAGPPHAIKGLMEVRGFGIVRPDFMPAARVHLVVDLIEPAQMERLPEKAVDSVIVEEVELPGIRCPSMTPHAAVCLVRWAFRSSFPQSPDYF
jgi:serine kinase of HPr protein (carbohydrate metabolism regulator)